MSEVLVRKDKDSFDDYAEEPATEVDLPTSQSTGDIAQQRISYDLLKFTFWELISLFRVALPIFITFLAFSLMAFVDLLFLGYLNNVNYISSASISNSYSIVLIHCVLGMCGALDTLVSQAYGARNLHVMRLCLYRAVVVTSVCFIPIIFMFVFSEPIFKAMVRPEEVEVATLAVTFTLLILPGLYPLLLYRCCSAYLNAQSQVFMPMIVGIVANICNAIFNALLVKGINYEALGFIGAPIGTSLARLVMCVVGIALVLFVEKRRKKDFSSAPDQKKSIVETMKETVEWTGIKEFFKLALPSAIMQCVGLFGFQITSIIAARIGSTSVSAHSIVLNLGIQTFMMPASLGSATSIRVGQRLGANDPKGAKWVCWLGVFSGAFVMAISGIVIFFTKSIYANIFVDNEEVRALTEQIMPVLAFYQVFDGIQGVCNGVIRGTGRQVVGACTTFLAHFVIGIPLGCLLTFYFEYHLFGMWIGLATGLFIVSTILVLFLSLRIDWEHEAKKAAQRIAKSDTHIGPEKSEGAGEEEVPEEGVQVELIEQKPEIIN